MQTSSGYELFGADIALGEGFQAQVAANGELILCEEAAFAVQMVALRIFTMTGSLFYDVDYGSITLNWIREESTPRTREALTAEVERACNDDPHVQPGTAACKVASWDHTGVDLDLQFTLINQPHPDHLLLRLGEAGFSFKVVAHANPRQDSRP